MSVSLLVGLLPYWNETYIGIYPVLDEISYWIFLHTFLGCCYNRSKYFCISWMSLSLWVGLLPYWNCTNIGLSPVMDDIFLKTFWTHFGDVGTLDPNNFEFIVCLWVCKLAYFLTENRQIYIDDISLWDFLMTFLICCYTISK